MARAPKVYVADIDGLHDWIVAAPNQGEALAAFGVNQDLFLQGRARLAADSQLIEVARASPSVALRRLKGSGDEFRPVGEGGVEAWEKAAKASGARTAPRSKRVRVDRSALDRAVAALEAFEAKADEAREVLATKARDLEGRRRDLERRLEDQARELRERVETEQRKLDS